MCHELTCTDCRRKLFMTSFFYSKICHRIFYCNAQKIITLHRNLKAVFSRLMDTKQWQYLCKFYFVAENQTKQIYGHWFLFLGTFWLEQNVSRGVICKAWILEKHPSFKVGPHFVLKKSWNFRRSRGQNDVAGHFEIGWPESKGSVTANNFWKLEFLDWFISKLVTS
jgi:hypothetical protein